VLAVEGRAGRQEEGGVLKLEFRHDLGRIAGVIGLIGESGEELPEDLPRPVHGLILAFILRLGNFTAPSSKIDLVEVVSNNVLFE
jgi:hypothetical protein